MTAALPPLDPEQATELRDDFLVAQRKDHSLKPRFLTDWHFDLEKLFGLYDAAGIAYDAHPIIPYEDAVTDQQILDPPGMITWTIPDPDDHYTFGPAKQHIPPWRMMRLSSVRLSYDITRPGQPEFYVFTEAGEVVNGLFYGGKPFLEDTVLSIEDPCVFADDFFISFNICHLLFDKLPRAVAGHDLGATAALFFRAPPYVSALCTLFDMTAIGVTEKRGTIFLRDCICLTDSFHQLMHPGRFGATPHMTALGRVSAQVRAALGTADDAPKRYFLKRAPELPRAIENEDEIVPLLQRHGFTLGDPGTLDPLEQIRLFSSVTHLGGVHGAGLANLAFQAPGSHVLELLPPLCATGAYWQMSQKRGLHYHHLVCEDPEQGAVDAKARTHDVRFNRRNVVVPPARFDALLEQMTAP